MLGEAISSMLYLGIVGTYRRVLEINGNLTPEMAESLDRGEADAMATLDKFAGRFREAFGPLEQYLEEKRDVMQLYIDNMEDDDQ